MTFRKQFRDIITLDLTRLAQPGDECFNALQCIIDHLGWLKDWKKFHKNDDRFKDVYNYSEEFRNFVDSFSQSAATYTHKKMFYFMVLRASHEIHNNTLTSHFFGLFKSFDIKQSLFKLPQLKKSKDVNLFYDFIGFNPYICYTNLAKCMRGLSNWGYDNVNTIISLLPEKEWDRNPTGQHTKLEFEYILRLMGKQDVWDTIDPILDQRISDISDDEVRTLCDVFYLVYDFLKSRQITGELLHYLTFEDDRQYIRIIEERCGKFPGLR